MHRRIPLLVAAALLSALPCGSFAQVVLPDRGAEAMALASAPYERATDFVNYLAYGNYYRAWTMLSAPLRQATTPEGLRKQWQDLEGRLGRFHLRKVAACVLDGDRWRLHLRCDFERGCADAVLSFSSMAEDPPVLSYSFRPMAPEECARKLP